MLIEPLTVTEEISLVFPTTPKPENVAVESWEDANEIFRNCSWDDLVATLVMKNLWIANFLTLEGALYYLPGLMTLSLDFLNGTSDPFDCYELMDRTMRLVCPYYYAEGHPARSDCDKLLSRMTEEQKHSIIRWVAFCHTILHEKGRTTRILGPSGYSTVDCIDYIKNFSC